MFMIQPDAIRSFAQLTVSHDADAIKLQCDACGRDVDTYIHAYDDTEQEIFNFLEHTAYDHMGRATILEVKLSRFARVMSQTDQDQLAIDMGIKAAR